MNVGDYIRTKDGVLGKIIDKYKINDYYKIKVDIRNGWIEKHREDLFKKHIIKSSPQIIDLIEAGDYVNGYLVIEEPYTYHDIKFISVDTQDSWGWGKGEMPIENIKTIVTHEQMKTMQYKVEE